MYCTGAVKMPQDPELHPEPDHAHSCGQGLSQLLCVLLRAGHGSLAAPSFG